MTWKLPGGRSGTRIVAASAPILVPERAGSRLAVHPSPEVVMPGSVIVAGARTPIGKLSGALAGFSAMDLGGFAIAAALERAGVKPDQVDYVLMGQVLQAGQGQITARQAAVKAGIPMTIPATTINKGCLSRPNA